MEGEFSSQDSAFFDQFLLFDDDILNHPPASIDSHVPSLAPPHPDLTSLHQFPHDEWLTDVHVLGSIGDGGSLLPSLSINGIPPVGDEIGTDPYDFSE